MFNTMLVYTDGRVSRVCHRQFGEWHIEYVQTETESDTFTDAEMSQLISVWGATSYERIVYLQTVGE